MKNISSYVFAVIFLALSINQVINRQPGLAGSEDISLSIVFFVLAVYLVITRVRNYFGGFQSFLGVAFLGITFHSVTGVIWWGGIVTPTVTEEIIAAFVSAGLGTLFILWGYKRHQKRHA